MTKPGPKPMAKKDQRTDRVVIVLHPTEAAEVRKAAKLAKTSASAWARDIVLNALPKQETQEK